jgi:hypothetical protein
MARLDLSEEDGAMRRIGGVLQAALAAGLLGVVAAPAAGSPATPGRAPAVQAVLECRKIEDSGQRLACFDKAVATMEQAEATGDLVTIDREQRRAARHQAFGLPLPTLSFLDRGEKPEEVDRILARINSASQDPYGKWTLHLDDGAVWRQIDDKEIDRPPHAGSAAEIRRGVLGSFTMKIDGQFPIKVHRDS